MCESAALLHARGHFKVRATNGDFVFILCCLFFFFVSSPCCCCGKEPAAGLLIAVVVPCLSEQIFLAVLECFLLVGGIF